MPELDVSSAFTKVRHFLMAFHWHDLFVQLMLHPQHASCWLQKFWHWNLAVDEFFIDSAENCSMTFSCHFLQRIPSGCWKKSFWFAKTQKVIFHWNLSSRDVNHSFYKFISNNLSFTWMMVFWVKHYVLLGKSFSAVSK